MTIEDEIMNEAEYMVRREKWTDFLNDPKLFFKRLHFGYYDEQVLYNVRWIIAKEKEENAPLFSNVQADDNDDTGKLW